MARIKPARGSTSTNYGTKFVYARTINRPARELYRQLRDLENLIPVIRNAPKIFSQDGFRFEMVTQDGKCRIVASIINEEPGSLLAWASEPESDFAHAGTIRFDSAPGDEGTEITVTIEYEGERGSAKLSKLALGGPGKVVADTLRRFKALVETGEMPTIEGQPVGEPQKSKRKK